MNPYYHAKKLREFRERRKKFMAASTIGSASELVIRTMEGHDLTERSLFDRAILSIELHRDEYAYFNQLAKEGVAYLWAKWKDKAASKKWIFAPKPFDYKSFFRQVMP